MRKIILAAVVASTFLITACNTVAGIGRDVESVGDTVEDSAT